MEKSEQLEIASTHKGKRVEIYLEVDDHGAIRKESIPFVLGVLSPLSGDKEAAESFGDREAKQIDRENFDGVMEAIGPELHYSVDRTVPPDPGAKDQESDLEALPVNLYLSKMEHFEPDHVAKQIPRLNELLEERKALGLLLRRLYANPQLESKVLAALADPELRRRLLEELAMSQEQSL